jgi:hypothetical protein
MIWGRRIDYRLFEDQIPFLQFSFRNMLGLGQHKHVKHGAKPTVEIAFHDKGNQIIRRL